MLKLFDYLAYTSVSNNPSSDRTLDTINFQTYIDLNPDIQTTNYNLSEAKEHFIRFGQFEYRAITFKKKYLIF